MASWADIKAYTADEIAAAKAEIDTVITVISAKLADHKHRNGRLTDEDHYANLFVEQELSPRAATFSLVVTKALIKGTTFATTAAKADTEAKAKAEVEAQLAVLELDGAATEVEKVSYTAAETGVDGSYVFKVNLSKSGVTAVTDQITMTITA